MHELKKKNSANLKIEMIDLRKNLTAKEDELLATKELLLKEESTPGPKISCVEDPLNIQSKQSDLDCSVEVIESENGSSSGQQHQEKSLSQGNLSRGIENITFRINFFSQYHTFHRANKMSNIDDCFCIFYLKKYFLNGQHCFKLK